MILFPDKKDCCACGSCRAICPQTAISMREDNLGFIYPEIDSQKCIDCGLCQKVCAYQHIKETNKPQCVYAAVSKNKEQLKKSASGGVFAALATFVLSKGGVVYGSVMEREGNQFVVRYRGITSLDELHLLQGSKYVQSDMGNCYKEIKAYLVEGRMVLFSGVPCQCAGLKGYLRTGYDNLILIDIICHGVPNQRFFNDYINYTFSKLRGISGFVFRDKSEGWELKARLDYANNRYKFIVPGVSSYYALFLDAQIYRENCYSCKYASSHRPGDITIGDYWGIQKEHPELVAKDKLNIQEGVSCIITNTPKGDKIITEIQGLISTFPSSYAKVASHNGQLMSPSRKGIFRQQIFDVYQTQGYSGVNKLYKKNYRLKRLIGVLFNILPYCAKNVLRQLKS